MTLNFVYKTRVGGNVWAFAFEPSTPLHLIAGQFIKIEIPHSNPDGEGTKRFFTISSTPQDPHIVITTRITASTFKQALYHIKPDTPVPLLDLPAGNFTWQTALMTPTFIAKGIGVTPFYAILKDRIQRKLPPAATLIYAGRPGEDVPYLSDLTAWSAANPEFTLITRQEALTPRLVASLVPHITATHVYISGPSALIGLTAPPYNLPVRQYKTDFFPGYPSEVY